MLKRLKSLVSVARRSPCVKAPYVHTQNVNGEQYHLSQLTKVTDSITVLCSTQHRQGHFGNVVPSQSLVY